MHEIIQHVEYSTLMARVAKITEYDTAQLRKQSNSGIVQNMDWTGLDSWTGQLDWTVGQLDWTVGLDSWTGQLDWTVGLDSWTGQLDWTIGLEFFSIKYMQFDVFEENEMIIFKLLCFFL